MAHSSLYQQSINPTGATSFFRIKEDWYYQTREGLTIGPFESRKAAAESLDDYVAVVNGVKPEDMPLAPLRRFFESPGHLKAG